MARDALTGSRIRERRTMVGLKQAELARTLGISASYLNLIEHNRRRIGGKLLLNIAQTLGVDAQLLTEGAEAALLATLREAAEDLGLAETEADRADEFAGRFPGWADVLAGTRQQVTDLERTIEALNDRIAHDPFLADSMHELLSTATAVRSTAAILAETKTLRPEWRDRFHANIDEDSRRLSESAQALVTYLDVKSEGADAPLSPVEEVSAFMTTQAFAFEALEQPLADDKTVAEIVRAAPQLVSQAARNTAVTVLSRMIRDAQVLPLSDLRDAMALRGLDPIALAGALDCPVVVVLRRLASLPEPDAALIVTDRSGAVMFRKSTRSAPFAPGAAGDPHALMLSALGTPGLVVRERIDRGRLFECVAVTDTVPAARYNVPPAVMGVMLLCPASGDSAAAPQDSTLTAAP